MSTDTRGSGAVGLADGAPAPTLTLLQPDALPGNRNELSQAAILYAFPYLAPWTSGRPRTVGALSSGVEAAATALRRELGATVRPDRPEDAPDGRPVPVGRGRDYDEHDEFFGVRRVVGPPAGTYWLGLTEAYSTLMADVSRCGTSLDAGWWNLLLGGVTAMARYTAGLEADGPPEHPVPSPRVPEPVTPVHRWRAGHHLFFTLTQSMVVSLSCFGRAAIAGDGHAAAGALDLTSELMLASGGALRFAGDFDPARYQDTVRPSMSPPNLPDGFSGLQARDHHQLVQLMGRLRPLMSTDLFGVQCHRERLVGALECLYESHAWVCGRFDGDSMPSLRMVGASDLTAVQVIQRLMRARRRLVTPEQPASATTPARS